MKMKMKMKNQFTLMLIIISIFSITSCGKGDDSSTPTPTPTASISFLNLTFNPTDAYFSSDGSMTAPVNSTVAKTITSKVDITFIFNIDESEPGFFDPIARSQEWYWDDYYQPWLSTGCETRYYKTSLTSADFKAAITDQSKIATYFSETSNILAQHPIYTTGSCIGGRQLGSSETVELSEGKVFGFKNTASGKRGLLYIRADQDSGWPIPVYNFNTKVDIIREN